MRCLIRITLSCSLSFLSFACARPERLAEPSSTTDGFSVQSNRKWVIKDAGLTGVAARGLVTASAPVSVKQLQISFDNERPILVPRNAQGLFTLEFPAENMSTGEHKVIIAPDGTATGTASASFQVSAPYFAVVSTDWDDSRFKDDYVRRMEQLHANHPELLVTHFFGPYHFTDPVVAPARKAALVKWVLNQRDQFHDEIGMHFHGWCHFVKTTGVPCETAKTFYQDDRTGYTTIVAAYSRADMATILRAGIKLFEQAGLGKPKSFRAGGWTADLNTIGALVDTGFIIDSSAVPPKFISDWKDWPLYGWLVAHWTGITERSQPYWPSRDDILVPASGNAAGLLEVPDNGALVDYMDATEMLQVLNANQPGQKALSEAKIFHVGYHPPSFSEQFFAELDQTLRVVDKRLASRDQGPMIYVRVEDLAKIWRQ